MFIKSIVTGTVITAILVAVLAATRLMEVKSDPADLTLYEIEAVVIPAPPEPPIEEEQEMQEQQEEVETIPLAPIPAMDLIADASMDSTPLPLTTASFDPQLAVSPFEIDREPAGLPTAIAPPRIKPVVSGSSKPNLNMKPPPTLREVEKSHYSPSELDRNPQELRKGSFTWPSNATGTSGSVKLLLEITTTGKVSVISVLSSTDPNLTTAAKRVAENSRFTSPTYRGKPVNSKFYKTYHLKKPR